MSDYRDEREQRERRRRTMVRTVCIVIAAAMLLQPESAVALSAASIRPHLIIRDSAQPPE